MKRYISPLVLSLVFSCSGDTQTDSSAADTAAAPSSASTLDVGTPTGMPAASTGASVGSGPVPEPEPEPEASATSEPSPTPQEASDPSPAVTAPVPSVMPTTPAPEATVPVPAPEPMEMPGEPVMTPEPEMPAEPGPVACSDELPVLDEPGFDCGDAHIMEDSGPPSNRVNYVIVADGYQENELDMALVEHVENMLYNEATGMYSEIGEPYTRYRKFINVCVLRTPSNESGVDGPGGNPDRDTIFDGGNCGDRLGCVDDRLVQQYLNDNLPEHVDADWIAATMNANEWWNSGGLHMVWSGKYMETDARSAASVALHEGGHAFHQLADEYGDDNLDCNCGSAREPNVACESDPALSSESKWGEWLGFVMDGGGGLWNLGEHGAYPGGRYCGPSSGVTRPTKDSEMNILPYAHNMPSIEKAIHDIYEIVRPIDAHTPNDAVLTDATELAVRLVDPAVLELEWAVDGEIVSDASGECFSLQGLASGEHTVSARAYDDTPWVRDNRDDLEQTIEWTVSVP